ncbi:MAG: PEP-CTERM sorting domain-containing protein [Planctomycetaceae bacterium]|nr:PEP-CTERM sorting domain-containing protein [Planctomycetaceae bacterium]
MPITYSYGNAAGSTVDFIGVSETPTLASAADQKAHFEAISKTEGPFGAPSVGGDSLLFNPATFSLTVVGVGADILDSQLSFTIAAKAGYGIDAFGIQEAGDYTFPVGGGAGTWASVGAAVSVVVTEIDGKAVTPIFVPTENAVILPSSSFFGTGSPVPASPWSGTGYVDIAAYLASLSIMGTATQVDVTLDNTLYAGSSEAGKIAKIQKKLFDGTSITVVTNNNPIPEPSSLVLAALGAVGVGWCGRRQFRKS